MTALQQRVLRAFEAGHALKIGDDVFPEKWLVHGVHGEPRDIAVSIEWSDERSYIWELDFTEQSLNEAKIDGNEIRMIDSQGEEVLVTIFQLEAARI